MRTIGQTPRVWRTRTIGIAIAVLTVCWGQAMAVKLAEEPRATPLVPSAATPPAQSPAPAAAKSAEYIGEARCIECHGQENKHFSETLHAKVFRLNPKNDAQKQGCESCHGPGSNHARNALDKTALVGFTKRWGTPVETQNAQCLTCHEGGTRMHWPGSTHAKSQLGCADCHNPMQKVSGSGMCERLRNSARCCLWHW